MYFQHAEQIWREFPELAAGVIFAGGLPDAIDLDGAIARFTGAATTRLTDTTESQFPEIVAWRHAFSRMGLKPTQYRCAAEALLRRLRREGTLPSLHPVIDLCNAVSAAFAIPVAALDASAIAEGIEVRHADGDEVYLTFSGEPEHPEPGEVIFADEDDRAHARRWTNRQSGLSAVRAETRDVLVVAEAMHASAASDVSRLVGAIAEQLSAAWQATSSTAMLNASSPRFEFNGERPDERVGHGGAREATA